MNAEIEHKAIGISSVDLSPNDQALIRSALDVANEKSRGTHSYVLLENPAAEQTHILIASLNSSNANNSSRSISLEYGSKSTIFITKDTASMNTRGHKYVISQNDLENNLVNMIDRISREELRISFIPNHTNQPVSDNVTPSQNEDRRQIRVSGHVLVVDDSPSVRTQMDEFLSKRRFKCHFAENAEDAIQAVTNRKFSMIFLDVIMPGTDGYQTCKALKTLDSVKEIPVIMLTSKNNPIDKIHGIMSGCDEYLIKPVRSSELTGILKNYFPQFKRALEARQNQ